MKQLIFDHYPTDRGGRRQIADRRFRVSKNHVPEQRTGWKRRSGWDRRWRQALNFKDDKRCTGPGVYLEY